MEKKFISYINKMNKNFNSAADVQGLAATVESTETGTMSNVQVNSINKESSVSPKAQIKMKNKTQKTTTLFGNEIIFYDDLGEQRGMGLGITRESNAEKTVHYYFKGKEISKDAAMKVFCFKAIFGL